MGSTARWITGALVALAGTAWTGVNPPPANPVGDYLITDAETGAGTARIKISPEPLPGSGRYPFRVYNPNPAPAGTTKYTGTMTEAAGTGTYSWTATDPLGNRRVGELYWDDARGRWVALDGEGRGLKILE